MATQFIAGANGVSAGAGGSNLLPKNVASDIWKKATAQSIVPTLSTNTPMILGENTFPTLTKRPAASIVGEGQQKPQSQIEVGSKTVKPIKAVVGLEFTMEAIMTNPAGVLGLMGDEMAGALARQIDLAVIHKRQASDGATLTSGVESIVDTTNPVVELPATVGADPDPILWEGYNTVVDGTGNNFTGFAVDPRLTYVLATARDENGRRLNPDINMGSQVSSYSGQPMVNSKTVGGDVDASTDTGIRAIGGDWDALKFGYVLNIPVKKIEYGDPFDNGDLQARNCVAYMAEVIFGWAIMDLSAFVVYALPDETP